MPENRWLRIVLPLAAVGVLIVVIAWMAGAFTSKIEPGVRAEGAVTVAPEDLFTVQQESVTIIEPVQAAIAAREATTISSRTLARITGITVRAGDSVTAGQLLVSLERSELEARLAQAEGAVSAIGARFIEAQQSLDRARELHAQELVAKATLDQARANHDALQAELSAARQSVLEAETALTYSEIKSPISGRVVERFAEPGDTATPGQKLLSIYNPSTVRIEADVRETLALTLQLGQELQAEIPAINRTLGARIEELVPAADPGSRSFTVKAQLLEEHALLPGMYARLLVPSGDQSVLLVPKDRILSYGQLDMVWLWSESGVQRRFVRSAPSDREGWRQVLAGLEAGDRILNPASSAGNQFSN